MSSIKFLLKWGLKSIWKGGGILRPWVTCAGIIDTIFKDSIIDKEIQIVENHKGTFQNISDEKTKSKVLLFSCFATCIQIT